jgi:hypothetical protein
MTIKGIMDLTRLSRNNVLRVVKKLYPDLMKKGKKTILSENQTEKVLMELRKKGILTHSQNGEVHSQNGEVHSQNGEVHSQNGEVVNINKAIESMNNLAAAIMANVQSQDKRMSAIESRLQKTPNLLTAPQIAPRDEISKLVRAAGEEKQNYRDMWHYLYNDFNYRMKRNFSVCAKSRNVSTLDYIEDQGFILELLATARELFSISEKCEICKKRHLIVNMVKCLNNNDGINYYICEGCDQ